MADIEPFSLTKERARFAHLNTREEKHGQKASKKGVDFKLVFDLNNVYLNRIAPGLQDMFYRVHETADMINPDNKPVLRFPKLDTQTYDIEVPRVTMRFHDPDKAENDMVLSGGKLNGFKFECKQGGTVVLTLRAQFSDPNEDEMVKANRVLFDTVLVSLSCAAEEEKPTLEEQAEALARAPQSEAGKKLADLFTGDAPAVGGGDDSGVDTLKFPDQDGAADPLKIDGAQADEAAAAAPAKKEKAAKPAKDQPEAKAEAPAPRPRRGSGKAVVAPE